MPRLISSGKDKRLVYSVRLIGDDTICVILGAVLKAVGNSLASMRH